MIIGVVSGLVITSHHTQSMSGIPLRIVQKVNPQGKVSDSFVVAVDALGAADGEYVLVASGSTARQHMITDGKPVDAIIISIIDTWQIKGIIQYEKMNTTG